MDVYAEDRPWGKFERYFENGNCTVKNLYLKPNSHTCLQYHSKLDEWWWVIEGIIKIHVNCNEFDPSENGSYYIGRG